MYSLVLVNLYVTGWYSLLITALKSSDMLFSPMLNYSIGLQNLYSGMNALKTACAIVE